MSQLGSDLITPEHVFRNSPNTGSEKFLTAQNIHILRVRLHMQPVCVKTK